MKFLALVTVLAVGACGDDVVLEGEPLYFQTELTVFDDNTDLYVGDPMFVDLLLFNMGDNNVTVQFPDSCLVGFEILRGREIVVAYPNECGGSPWSYEFRNIGTYSMSFVISTIDEIPQATWFLEQPTLPPGTYTLRAGLVVRPWAIPWAEIEFTVREWPRSLEPGNKSTH